MKLRKNKKITIHVGFFLRLKFAWKAFCLEEFEYKWAYEYCCDLRKDWESVCDNNRRSSKCENRALIALADPVFKIEIRESSHYYHVCPECAKKYEGTMHGEE